MDIRTILAILGTAGLIAATEAAVIAQRPTEHGVKQADGMEVTLLSAPPLSAEQTQKMMPGMGGMDGMPSTEGTMQGMPQMGGMGGAEVPPTHWIGVIVRDMKDDKVVADLPVTLAARKGKITRTVKLMPMAGSYGANISLPEKGRYMVTVTITRAGQPAQITFGFDYQ